MSKLTPTIDEHKAIIKSQVNTMIETLNTIQGYTNPTNAQVVSAVKKLAEYQEKIIRFLVNNI